MSGPTQNGEQSFEKPFRKVRKDQKYFDYKYFDDNQWLRLLLLFRNQKVIATYVILKMIK